MSTREAWPFPSRFPAVPEELRTYFDAELDAAHGRRMRHATFFRGFEAARRLTIRIGRIAGGLVVFAGALWLLLYAYESASIRLSELTLVDLVKTAIAGGIGLFVALPSSVALAFGDAPTKEEIEIALEIRIQKRALQRAAAAMRRADMRKAWASALAVIRRAMRLPTR